MRLAVEVKRLMRAVSLTRDRPTQYFDSRLTGRWPSARNIARLQLACLALIESGDEILMPDPSYPCNRQFVSAAEGTAKLLPVGAAERFQLSADLVAQHWTPGRTRGVLLASPSNPTGTSIAHDEMGRIAEVVRRRGGVTIVDEIYLGLSFDEAYGHSALAHGNEIISINSFSKYFSMTGWRLGWMVIPADMLRTVERNYEAFRREGTLPATFEVVYGHAWKPQARLSTTGRRVIDIKAALRQPAHDIACYRSIEAYKQSFKSKSDVLVLEPNSEFFKYLRSGSKGGK